MGEAAAVFLTMGTVIGTAVVGYQAARLRAAVAIHAIQSESEWLVEQHRQGQRDWRRSVYHDFLTLIYRLDAMMSGLAPLSRSSFEEWLDEYQRLYSGICLSASDPVRTETAEVKAALDAIGRQARHQQTSAPFEWRFAHAYLEGRGRLFVVVEQLSDRMRAEVGPY
jgi:hypothetical protein